MNGIILINKEKGYTSHDVVVKTRKILKTKKIGHLGTLDPNATGLLVLCINDATKLVPFLENDKKEYLAEVILGIETDTYDITGNVINKEIVNFTVAQIDKVLKSFIGKIKQYPPIYSAIKVNGKKLYEYARKNQDVEITPREVEIFELTWDNQINVIDGTIHFFIKALVSKGTYIRSLCHDIGQALKTFATMGDLKRLSSGSFHLEQALTIAELEKQDITNLKVISCLDALSMPVKEVLEEEELWLRRVKNGMKISLNNIKQYCSFITDTIPSLIAFSYQNELVAIYEYDELEKNYKAVRIWN